METFNRRRVGTIALVGAVLLLGFLAVLGWMKTYELVEVHYRTSASQEVRRNPYLAAKLLMEKWNINAESLSSRTNLYDFPETLDTLIVMGLGAELQDKQHEKLMNWIEQGGHLILEATHFWDEELQTSGNKLLDDLGVRLIDPQQESDCGCNDEDSSEDEGYSENEDSSEDEGYSEDEDYSEDEADMRDENSADKSDSSEEDSLPEWPAWEEVEIELWEGNSAKVAFLAHRAFQHAGTESEGATGNNLTTHFMQLDVGSGKVSVLSDADFWINPQPEIPGEEDPFEGKKIDKNDHAYFLWSLLRGDSHVWILHSLHSPSLLSFIWKYFPEALTSLVLLLALWSWWLRNSFGPLKVDMTKGQGVLKERRSLLEHLLMTIRFEWNTDKAIRRMDFTRELVHKELSSKHPKLSEMDKNEQCQNLSMLTGLNPEQVLFALYGTWEGEQQFVQLTSIIQRLRRKL